jgi:hypothetical protein
VRSGDASSIEHINLRVWRATGHEADSKHGLPEKQLGIAILSTIIANSHGVGTPCAA